jgi:hypothetical protein
MVNEAVPVDMLDLDGNFVKHFDKMKDAGNILGQQGDKIARVIKGERKSIEHRTTKIRYKFIYCNCKKKQNRSK